MPELPEVEFAARQLRGWAQGRRLTAVHDAKTRVTRGTKKGGLEGLIGRRLLSVERIGKWMLLGFDRGGGLVSHLGMTGKWLHREKGEASASHVRASLEFEGGVTLDYRDPRMFGRLEAAQLDELRKLPTLAAMGPDPLGGVDARVLGEKLARTRRSIKEALMDQTTLAGLGNIQVSESLHRARINPERGANLLSREEVARLAKGIAASLQFTLEQQQGEDPIEYVEEGGDNFFLVYGHAGEPCPDCGTEIERIVQGGRSTFFCPHCQPLRVRAAQPAPAPKAKAARPKSAKAAAKRPRARRRS